MVTKRQESKIEHMMRRIKRAHDNNMGEEEIKSRTNTLYNYLENEGLVDRFPEE